MKYVLAILLTVGVFTVASAQYSNDSYGRDRNWNDHNIRVENSYFNGNIDQINRYYDRKVWEVQNDYRLRPREKRRIIREINEERKYRIQAAQRENRRERRHWDW